jgi:NodT family efflux transporter outer membrane factor (OMF) lipoprotein
MIRRLTPLLVALGLSACAAVGPNYRPPTSPSPSGYVMAGDAAPLSVRLSDDARPPGAWWRVLGSAELDRLMREALKDNQTVAGADATLQQVRDLAAAERGGAYPQLGLNAGIQRERINTEAFGFPGFPSPTINLYQVGGMVSYDLDVFGGQRRRIEAADAQVAQQARRADAAYLTLTGDVAMAAAEIADLNARIEVLRAIAKDDETTIAIIRQAEAAGGDAPSAAHGSQARLAQDLALLPPLQQTLAKERHALAVLVGKAPAAWTPPDFTVAAFTPPATLDLAVPSTLLRRRPDIAAAEANLHAKTAQIGVATASLYPDLRLVAGLTQEALTPGALPDFASTAYNFGGQIAAPIFDGGTLRARKRAAEADARAALAQYRQTVTAALGQVADALTAIAHDDERLVHLTRAEALATASLEDARNAYRVGGGPRSDLVLAQGQLDRARLARVEAQGQRLADIVTLLAATAGDWRDPPDKTATS